MPVPKPPASLDNSCSVIHDNTLYSYSPQAFLSIPLGHGAKWKKLQMGVKVTGATCVGSTPPDAAQAGFYVVGGEADADDFTGLQKYTYSTGKWTTIKLSDQAIKNRQGHASTYIQANDAILVYAGSQDRSKDRSHSPSAQTFTIQASEPYAVNGYESIAPPSISPILMNWSGADAALLGAGANPQDAKIWLFNPAARWRDSGASLAQPLRKDESMQVALVNGDDGSKVAYIFDLGQSPNRVDRVAVQDAKGAPVRNSPPVTGQRLDGIAAVARRDLTLSGWPDYNSTLAPTVTRHRFAMAQGSDGMVVFSGGNNDSPLAIFNASQNGWVDAAALMAKSQVLSDLSTTSTAPTATTPSPSVSASSTNHVAIATGSSATSTIESAPANGNPDSPGPSSRAILGISLGSIAGFVALLGLVLLLLRWRKKRQIHAEAGHARRASGGPSDEKGSVDFTKGAFPRMSAGQSRGHYPQPSHESCSSMAILMGRMGGKEKSGLSRKLSTGTAQSSTTSLHKQFKCTISKPIPQMADYSALLGQDGAGIAFAPAAEPRPRNGPVEAQDGTRRSSGWNRYWSGGSALQILGFGAAKRNTTGSERSSHYSEPTDSNPRITQDSATVPPLAFEERPEVNSVNSGSPVVSRFSSKVHTDGISGKIERPPSSSASGYSSGIPDTINDGWDPTEADKSRGTDMAPNMAYAPEYHYGAPPAPPPPSGVSQQPQLITATKSSDMRWLRLEDQSRV